MRGGTEVLAEALRRLDGSGVDVLDVGLRRPDLDDVFLTLTGHAAEQDADEPKPDRRTGRCRPRPQGAPDDARCRLAVTDGLTITRRNLIKVKRVPDLIVFATLSPIMFVLLFRYVFGGAINVPGTSVTRSSCCRASSRRRSSSGAPSPAPASPTTCRRASSTGSVAADGPFGGAGRADGGGSLLNALSIVVMA